MASSLGYNVTMTLPATSRQTRAFDDRADALAHFFLRAGEAPRLLAYDDAVGCPLDQALAALEWTAAVGILAEDDLLHAGRLAADAAGCRCCSASRWAPVAPPSCSPAGSPPAARACCSFPPTPARPTAITRSASTSD